jgi:Tol biopolymer transport system component
MSWTRDNRIVYTSSAAGTVDLWIANADGSSPRQLTNDEGTKSQPVVTAGETIVYVVHARGEGELWRMNLDGAQRRQIAAAPMIMDFAVTPDAKSVVYAASDEARGGAALMRVPLDGGTPKQIARIGVFGKSLHLTPDGGAVIFSAIEDTAVKLFRVPLNGGFVTKLLPDRANSGTVSPDGKLLACTYGLAEPCGDLAILPLADGAPSVRALNGRIYRWSPDGQSIVYVKDEGTKDNLYELPLGGGEPKAITNFADGQIANFVWSPDGKRIVLTHYLQSRDVVMLNAAR